MMNGKLDVKNFGIAIGAASALAYAACVITMLVLPHETMIRLYNTLLHGVDIGPIMREDISLIESVFGCALTFILGGIFGAVIAAVYNACTMRSAKGANDERVS